MQYNDYDSTNQSGDSKRNPSCVENQRKFKIYSKEMTGHVMYKLEMQLCWSYEYSAQCEI